jgi:hypothetical protein
VEALDYEAPLAIRATTAAVFVLSGIAVASLLTWVSTASIVKTTAVFYNHNRRHHRNALLETSFLGK